MTLPSITARTARRLAHRLTGAALLLSLWQPLASALEVDARPLERLIMVSDGLSAGQVSVEVLPGTSPDTRVIVPGEKLRYHFSNLAGFTATEAGLADYGIDVSYYENHSILLSGEPWSIKVDRDAKPAAGLPPLRPGGGMVVTVPTAGLNLAPDKDYRVKVRIYDRQSKASYTLEHRFNVAATAARSDWREPQTSTSLGVELTTQGLAIASLSLEDEALKQALERAVIPQGKSLKLTLHDVEGLAAEADKRFLGYEVSLIDALGQTLMYFDDLSKLATAGTEARDPEDLSSTMKFSDPGRYLWTVRVFDKLNHRQLATKTWVEITAAEPDPAGE